MWCTYHIHTHSRHIDVPPPSSVLGQLTPVAGWLLIMKKYERIWRHTLSHTSLTCPSQIIELAWETPQSHWCCWKQCHKQQLMWKCRHEYQGECCHHSQADWHHQGTGYELDSQIEWVVWESWYYQLEGWMLLLSESKECHFSAGWHCLW